jgi:hypothetical protein
LYARVSTEQPGELQEVCGLKTMAQTAYCSRCCCLLSSLSIQHIGGAEPSQFLETVRDHQPRTWTPSEPTAFLKCYDGILVAAFVVGEAALLVADCQVGGLFTDSLANGQRRGDRR